jgi:hypothetical protein
VYNDFVNYFRSVNVDRPSIMDLQFNSLSVVDAYHLRRPFDEA